MLLLDLMLTAGLPWPSIVWTIFLDEAMVITGLLGALTKSRYKWGMTSGLSMCLNCREVDLTVSRRILCLRLRSNVWCLL